MKCIIHFGMHKTGSSSIQDSLWHSMPDQRFHYVNLGRPNASGSIQLAFKSNSRAHERLRDRGLAGNEISALGSQIRERLAAELEKARSKIAILSAESIIGLDQEGLAALMDFVSGYCREIQAFGYVRPPKGYIESAFQQVLKTGRWHLDLDNIFPAYRKRFEPIEQTFGKERVKFRLFSPSTFPEGDVVLDFCQVLGLDFPPSSVRRINEGLSLSAVRLLYVYHRFGSGLGAQKFTPAGNRLLAERLKDLKGPKLRLASNLIRPLIEEHQEDIAWMEERLGTSLREDLDNEGAQAIQSEDDLLLVDDEALEWLGRQLRQGKRVRLRAGMDPDEIAELMHRLKLKLLEESRQQRRDERLKTRRSGQGEALVRELVAAAKEAAPGQLAAVPEEAAVALLLEAFRQIGKAVANAGKEPVNIGGLGTFRVKNKPPVEPGAPSGRVTFQATFQKMT